MVLYGSLRDGLYNNRRFYLQNISEFMGTTKVRGYALYSLGHTQEYTLLKNLLWSLKCAGFLEKSSLK